MKSINELNQEYLIINGHLSTLNSCVRNIESLKSSLESKTTYEAFSDIVSATRPIYSIVTPEGVEGLFELIVIAENGQRFTQCMNIYKESIWGYLRKNDIDNAYISNVTDNLQDAQRQFELSRTAFYEKYGIEVDSEYAIVDLLLQALSSLKERLIEELESVKNQAKEILASVDSLELTAKWPKDETKELPVIMHLARCESGTQPCELLLDMGMRDDYNNYDIDIRTNGNVLVETDFAHTLDSELNSFVLAYIFKYIQAFPIGMVNVHIFDRNPNILNQRLNNAFKEGNYSERAKKAFTLYNYNSLSELSDVTKVITDDILKKSSFEYPDLFSIHSIDQSDPFTLIVLRDGLLDQGGHSATTILETIDSLTKPGDTGHASGIRFLIIDDSASRQNSLSEDADFLINSIKNNCEIKLDYSDHHFLYEGKAVEVVHIVDDINAFVQQRSVELAQRITNLEKQYVTVDEISNATVKNPDDSIFRIPIGKSGNSIVEIPLSCRDDNGTVDGQCIGYMVIGQSGSGKSSLFHSVVINGCLNYSPADLQFWLLDFKYGGTSSKYRNSKIPHVRIVSENNKIDDAFCLFQMIFDEMERRNKLINKRMVDNLVDYNSLVDKANRLPRIIILIDEVQEIFRDENAAELQKMISSISVRMRSVGMHFIMIAQNLAEGKSYMLKEAFLPSATGRICFRVSENLPRESGFDDAFIQRKSEIAVLSTGEAYVSWGKDTIKKVKMAYASTDDLNNQFFERIKSKYPAYSFMKPMVIGSKQRLSINAKLQNGTNTYADEIENITTDFRSYVSIVGEDSYRMDAFAMEFSSYENSALLLLGDDKEIASSLCTSIALSLIRQHTRIHLFNADRIKSDYDGIVSPHPFAYMCNLVKDKSNLVESHSLNEFKQVLKEIFVEYIRRMDLVQNSEEEVEFATNSIFLIVNDLLAIQQFTANDYIEDDEGAGKPQTNGRFDFSILNASDTGSQSTMFKERIQDALYKLIKDGYRYGINVVLAIKGDPSVWRNMRPTDVNNVVLFNTTQYANYVDNQYYVKEMLKNISPENGDETLAVCLNKKHISKFRPIIFDMSNQNEVECIESLLEVQL